LQQDFAALQERLQEESNTSQRLHGVLEAMQQEGSDALKVQIQAYGCLQGAMEEERLLNHQNLEAEREKSLQLEIKLSKEEQNSLLSEQRLAEESSASQRLHSLLEGMQQVGSNSLQVQHEAYGRLQATVEQEKVVYQQRFDEECEKSRQLQFKLEKVEHERLSQLKETEDVSSATAGRNSLVKIASMCRGS